VDFGITGYLDEQLMHQIATLFLGFAEHDYDLVLEALLGAGLIDEAIRNSPGFQVDLKDVSEQFYGRSLKTISVRDVYDQIMVLVLKYHLRLPRNVLLLLKTFVQTEALGKILGSEASLLEAARPYARQLLERGFDSRRFFRNFIQDVRTTGGYLKTVPRLVHDILEQTARGKQRWELWHGGLEDLNNQFSRGINRLTLGFIISASLIAAALVLNSGQKIFDVTVNFLGLKAIPLTSLFGLAGYVIATALGLWLIFSIFRSGKL
jgi:ubiquinone biosynthesis protein